MAPGKWKFLMGLLLLLAVACVPRSTGHRSLKAQLFSQDQCRQMVRKQRRLARGNSIPVNPLPGKISNSPNPDAGPALTLRKTRAVSLPNAGQIGGLEESGFNPATPVQLPVTDFASPQPVRAQLGQPGGKKAKPGPFLPAKSELQNPAAFGKHSVEIPEKVPGKGFSEQHAARFLQSVFQGVCALLAGLAAILIALRLKRISGWASENPWKSRALLTASHTGVFFGSLALGNYLSDLGMFIPDAVRHAGVVIFAGFALAYPVANSRYSFLRRSYFNRKFKDLVLFISGMMLLLHFTNHHDLVRKAGPPEPTAIYSFKSIIEPGKTVSVVRKAAFLHTAPDEAPPRQEPVILTVIKITLIVFLSAFLAMLVAALSCNLACSGMGGLALLVLGVGIPGVIALAVLAILAILRKARNRNADPSFGQ